jgi:hypothetical protein
VEESSGGDSHHGFFTGTLLDAVRRGAAGARADREGRIDARELAEFLQREVPRR